MSFLSKKKVGGVLAVLTLVVPFFLAPLSTQAQIGGVVTDPKHTAVSVGNAASSGATAAATGWDWFQKKVIDPAARTILKTIIKRVTTQTVNWINSGFQGQPGFVSDPGQFFLNVGDDTASQFLSSTALNKLCTPFKAEVRLALVKTYLSDDQQNFSCSLSKIQDNYEEFMLDFRQGGWEGWFELTQNDQNNPYGSYLSARNQLNLSVLAQKTEKKTQLDLGRGFLSFEKCPANKQLTAAQAEERNNATGENLKAGDCISKGDMEVATPGSVIETQLQNALGTDLRQLELARSFDEIATALITQLFSKVLSEVGLRGPSQPVPPMPSTDVPFITLQGANPMRLERGTAFIDPGALAYDFTDGDISGKITVSGRANTNANGTYNITYSVRNSKGKTASVVRQVIVGQIIQGGGDDEEVGTPPEGTEPGSLLADLIAERAKFPESLITKAQVSQILGNVAAKNAGAGWGLLSKTTGAVCPFGSSSISCDILFHKNTCYIYDSLGSATEDSGGPVRAIPQWNFAGSIERSRWVSPGGSSGPEPTAPCITLIPPDNGGGGETPEIPPTNPNPGVPLITTINPTSAKPGETTIRINGVDLTSTVQFFDASNNRQTVVGSVNSAKTQITVLVPAGIPLGTGKVRVYKDGSTVSNEVSIQYSNTVSGGGPSLPSTPPTSTWVPLQTTNGWWPSLSPNGRYVAYGNWGDSWVTDLESPTKETWNFKAPPGFPTPANGGGRCMAGQWLSNTKLTFVCEVEASINGGTIGFWRYEVTVGEWVPTKTDDNPTTLVSNMFRAKDGHWAAYAAPPIARITKDNQVVVSGTTGGAISLSGDMLVHACTNENQSICVRQGIALSRTYPVQTPMHMTATNAGYIAYGGYGPIHGITPTGSDIDLTVAPWRWENLGEIVNINGSLWVVTTSFDSATDKSYVFLRPWGSRSTVVVEAAAVWVSVAYKNGNILIAYNNDIGRMTVVTIPATTTRSVLN